MCCKYVVHMQWSDGEDTGTDQFFNLSEARSFIYDEMALCVDTVEENPDYPVGVFPTQILITRIPFSEP